LFYAARYLGRPVHIDPSSSIALSAKIKIVGGGSIRIGKKCKIYDDVMILSYGGHIVIGDYSSVNPYSVLYGNGGLKIGSFVRIAAHTVVIPADHIFADKDKPICLQGETRRGISIEDDVWLGAGCHVLDGVVIGKGSVIGAGSVVTKSVPEYSVAVGVPAKVIAKRGDEKAAP